MKRFLPGLFAFVLFSGVAGTMTGCEKGAAEDAGAEADKMIEDASDKIEELTD